MPPGPAAPSPVEAAAIAREIAGLKDTIGKQEQLIAAMQQKLQQGAVGFERLKQNRMHIAIHLAALLVEKFGGGTFVKPETIESIYPRFAAGEIGGFDFDPVGPDAVGPQRIKIRVQTRAEMQAQEQHALDQAKAQFGPVAPTTNAIATAAAAEPEGCSHLWHKVKNAKGANCPACGLRFPQAS
jgi:hypothetical protein